MNETDGKTPEQVKADKFAADPSKFFHEDEIIIAAIKSDNGIMTCHGAHPRGMMEQALTRINYKTNMVFQMMDLDSVAKKEKSPIIVGKHNGAPLYKNRG